LAEAPAASDQEAWRSHKFIRYADEKFLTAEASRVAAYVLNHWLKQKLSVSKYRRMSPLDLAFTSSDGQSRPISLRFDHLVDHIRARRSLRAEEFGLPLLESEWLDYAMGMAKPDAPIANTDYTEFAKLALASPFGPAFPLQPCIDREGAMYASFQVPIQQNITALHERLVANSHQAASLDNAWRNDLRMLINESVSLIDITLHQLYFMAQYRGQEQGWRFEPEKLGPRHGQRLKDKLAWVGQITGRHLDDAAEELSGFHRLRVVRNHFNHFDPPCVAYTVEDVIGWLNDVPRVGRLAWKIREKAGAQISTQLIEVIALPRTEFVARFPELPRVAQPRDVGYGSVVWPDATAADE
jgi:hypothetical protein